MMALTSVSIFVINFVFGMCIDSSNAYKILRPMRRSMISHSFAIPIRPLDHSTIRRLSRRPIELNPDSESVFLPMHQAKRRPLQIMERISVPVDHHHKKKENFNILNFDAYLMKPTNDAAIKPVTERILRLINHTEDDQNDAKPSSSSHHKYRTQNLPKKPKKNVHMSHVKGFDGLEFYRAFLEHQKHEAMVKRLKSKPESSSKLPIGIDYFENKKKNKMIFPPITYSSHYLNNLQRSHQYEDVEASNVQQVKMRHPDIMKNEQMPSVQQSITPYPTALATETDRQQAETVSPSKLSNEPETNHSLASEPEMYKFTIKDVVVKPQALRVVQYPLTGPVTLAPPSIHYPNTPNSNFIRQDDMLPASPNTIVENCFDPHTFPTQINYPPKVYVRGNTYRRFEKIPYENVVIDGSASAATQQEIQKYSVELVDMTTQTTFATETEQTIAPPVKAALEIDAKRIETKRNKKRRLNAERHRLDNMRKVNHQKDFLNSLEFSSSYSKQRTQGYNSEEETATTQITPIKSGHNRIETKQRQKQLFYEENNTINTPKKSEKVKYFQDILTEQLTPHQIDTAHLSENPAGWEERYERKNLKAQRFQGKIKWGDRKGHFGEHYYDLNHHLNLKQSNNTR